MLLYMRLPTEGFDGKEIWPNEGCEIILMGIRGTLITTKSEYQPYYICDMWGLIFEMPEKINYYLQLFERQFQAKHVKCIQNPEAVWSQGISYAEVKNY